jgi:hypothetical protein
MSRIIDKRNRETQRLDLPSGEWIEVYTQLTAGESRRMKNAGLKYKVEQTTKNGADNHIEVGIDVVAMDFAKVLTRLHSWSLKTGDGYDVQVNTDNVDNLPEDTFDEIVKAIDDFVMSVVKGKNSQSPGEPERHAKFVGAGSTVATS